MNDIYFSLLSLQLALLSALVFLLGLSIYNIMHLRMWRFLSNGRRGGIKVIFRMFLSDFVYFWAFFRGSGGAVVWFQG